MPMKFLRFPGTLCPQDALTGDAVLDAYMIELDARLLGSAWVRALTLAEIKDHLEERAAAALEQGAPEQEATRAAVEAMGPVEAFARPQRRALLRRFLAAATQAGTFFFIVTWAFGALGVTSRSTVSGLVPWAAFMGVWVGWIMTFAAPSRHLPSDDPGETFRVGYHPFLRLLSLGFALGCVVGVLAGLSAAALGPDPLELFHGSRWGALLFAAVCVLNLLVAIGGLNAYHADPEGFAIERWRGRERVPWAAVRSVQPLVQVRKWVPRNYYWKTVLALEYARPDGTRGRVNVFPDTANADRFILMARRKLDEAQPPPGG